jgi:hypothetical protein
LRKGLEGTLRGAARAWKIAPGDSPGLVLASTRAFSALQPGAAPKREDLDVFAIAQAPSEPTARACLAACLDLAASGEAQTPAGRKQFDELAEAVGVMNPQTAKALALGLQTAERDEDHRHMQVRRLGPSKTRQSPAHSAREPGLHQALRRSIMVSISVRRMARPSIRRQME